MRRLRAQDGVTLPELLVAMTIGLATVLAVYAILDTTMKQSSRVAGRVNATQRARIAMDTMTRQLRSQVCYSAVVPALVSGSSDAVRFHVDLSDGSRAIEQRELAFSPTAGTIRERVWPGQGAPLAFPTRTVDRELVGEVVRAKDPLGNQIPVFRYYAYNSPAPPGVPRPVTLLSTPLSATDLARVAKIEVGFVALPPGERMPANGSLPAGASALQNEIYVRVADPNDPAPTPTCA
jgi:prepilin-type N-terminal cleavage/methylation domain-containing protein